MRAIVKPGELPASYLPPTRPARIDANPNNAYFSTTTIMPTQSTEPLVGDEWDATSMERLKRMWACGADYEQMAKAFRVQPGVIRDTLDKLREDGELPKRKE